jgi:hypothetical protein
MSTVIKMVTAFYAVVAIIVGTLLWLMQGVDPVMAYSWAFAGAAIIGTAEFFLARWYFTSQKNYGKNYRDYDGCADYTGEFDDDNFYPAEEFKLNGKVDPFDSGCCGGGCHSQREEFYDENIDAPDDHGSHQA